MPISIGEIPDQINRAVGDIYRISEPLQGQTSDVCMLDCAGGKYVLKRTKGQHFSSWLNREVSVLNHLKHTDLLVPEVYEFIFETNGSQAWALLEQFPGEPMSAAFQKPMDIQQKYDLIYQYGKMLAFIHSIPCPASLKEVTPWVDRMLEKAEKHLLTGETDGDSELLEQLKNTQLSPVTPVLIHGDFTMDNVLALDGKITGVIDWSGGDYGDPRYDLALAIRPKSFAFKYPEEREIFFKGYGKRALSEEEYDYFVGLYEFF